MLPTLSEIKVIAIGSKILKYFSDRSRVALVTTTIAEGKFVSFVVVFLGRGGYRILFKRDRKSVV